MIPTHSAEPTGAEQLVIFLLACFEVAIFLGIAVALVYAMAASS